MISFINLLMYAIKYYYSDRPAPAIDRDPHSVLRLGVARNTNRWLIDVDGRHLGHLNNAIVVRSREIEDLQHLAELARSGH